MSIFITLTKVQGDPIRGVTSLGNALDPIVLADAITYILPPVILTDPAHTAKLAQYKTQLSIDVAKLPELDIQPAQFASPPDINTGQTAQVKA